MGYSERYCHICGVSFNMGRVRTRTEPRSHAWHQVRSRDLLSFVGAGRNSWIGECDRKAGCMLAFREDMAKDLRLRQRKFDERAGKGLRDVEKNAEDEDEDDVDDEDFMPDEIIMEKLHADHQFNLSASTDASALVKLKDLAQSILATVERKPKDGIRTRQVGSDDYEVSGHDMVVDCMDYEYDSPVETCSDSGVEDWEGSRKLASEAVKEAEVRYRAFLERIRSQNGVEPVPVQDELVLPLFRPLDGRDENTAPMHGSNGSFECDAEAGSDDCDSQKLDHWISGKLSHYHHTLSGEHTSQYNQDLVWEHIAGPGCLNNRGYHGDRISEEEMRFANTLQCLVQKKYRTRGMMEGEVPPMSVWRPEWDDEPWECDSSWFLSGVSDYMPSRDMDDPELFPPRHGLDSVNAENVRWDTDDEDLESEYAMPFHPACFEIYKRTSAKRHGSFDVNVLGSWWLQNAGYDEFGNFPRSDAVQRGVEQEWQHNPGDEHLAADPLQLPWLRSAIVSATPQRPLAQTRILMSRFTALPLEITIQVLSHLDVVEMAKTSIALPGIRPITRELILKHLNVQFPYLWELTSTEVYYKWVGLTANELQLRQEKLDREKAEYEIAFKVLQEDGHDEAREQLRQWWDEGSEVRKTALFGSTLQGRSPLHIPVDEIDVPHFALAFYEALEAGNLKGFENRARIWQDCETILDQIEDMQRQGDILPDGQLRPGARSR